ncbi:MAG: sigma-70 family RNA polymerase sigma factor [Acidobacteria bacterium]|jgi:RNA polymerase sigma-70 factor (ECF subfamily)|nr:sigma-70 family RNA polymerase sigma factor [Acidobacteriota bacterium]
MAYLAYQSEQNGKLSILQRIAQKDKTAVEECFGSYGGLVWSIAKKFTNSREDAEDAVQDIFIDIWKYAGRFDAAKSAESSFIVLLARRRLIDRLRKFNRQPKVFFLDEIANNQSDGWEKKLQMQIEIQQAVQELNKLNPQQRKVVQMVIYAGMTQSEIAETTGLPLGTVKSLIRRGFQKIRQSYSIEVENKLQWIAA